MIYQVEFNPWERPAVRHPASRSIDNYVTEQEKSGRGPLLATARKKLADRLIGKGAVRSLKALRLATGVSQSQLGSKIGTSQSRIARLEAGIEEPGLKTLRKLAKALGTDINTLADAFDG